MNILQGYSTLELLGLIYLALCIIKVLLIFGNLGVASRVFYIKQGGAYSMVSCFALLLILTVPITAIRVPFALYSERFRFFLCYSNKKVIRDILRAF